MTTNPFDLPGPEFLIFYTVLGIAVNVGLRSLLYFSEPRAGKGPLQELAQDPYLVAQLRGGFREAVRVTLTSLMSRGLLKHKEPGLLKTDNGISRTVAKRPLEQALLEEFDEADSIDEAFGSSTVQQECDAYDDLLRRYGLIAGDADRQRRATFSVAAIALLGGIALCKLYVAYQRHRHNVGFLIVLTIAFAVWCNATAKRRRTRAGDEAIASLKRSFARLKSRARELPRRGETNELAYLAGVFGIAAVPADIYPFVSALRKNSAFRQGEGGSGCSGCGGGSGCSGGSSGCGGGCGGCGGCGG